MDESAYKILKKLTAQHFSESRILLGLLSGQEYDFWINLTSEHLGQIKNLGLLFLLNKSDQGGFIGAFEIIANDLNLMLDDSKKSMLFLAAFKYSWNRNDPKIFARFSETDQKFWQSSQYRIDSPVSAFEILKRYLLETPNPPELSSLVTKNIVSIVEIIEIADMGMAYAWLKIAEQNSAELFLNDKKQDIPYELAISKTTIDQSAIQLSLISMVLDKIKSLPEPQYDKKTEVKRALALFKEISASYGKFFTLQQMVVSNLYISSQHSDLFLWAVEWLIDDSKTLDERDFKNLLELYSSTIEERKQTITTILNQIIIDCLLTYKQFNEVVANKESRSLLPLSILLKDQYDLHLKNLNEENAWLFIKQLDNIELPNAVKPTPKEKAQLLNLAYIWYKESPDLIWKSLQWCQFSSSPNDDFYYWVAKGLKNTKPANPDLTNFKRAMNGHGSFWPIAEKISEQIIEQNRFFVLAINRYLLDSDKELSSFDWQKCQEILGLLNEKQLFSEHTIKYLEKAQQFTTSTVVENGTDDMLVAITNDNSNKLANQKTPTTPHNPGRFNLWKEVAVIKFKTTKSSVFQQIDNARSKINLAAFSLLEKLPSKNSENFSDNLDQTETVSNENESKSDKPKKNPIPRRFVLAAFILIAVILVFGIFSPIYGFPAFTLPTATLLPTNTYTPKPTVALKATITLPPTSTPIPLIDGMELSSNDLSWSLIFDRTSQSQNGHSSTDILCVEDFDSCDAASLNSLADLLKNSPNNARCKELQLDNPALVGSFRFLVRYTCKPSQEHGIGDIDLINKKGVSLFPIIKSDIGFIQAVILQPNVSGFAFTSPSNNNNTLYMGSSYQDIKQFKVNSQKQLQLINASEPADEISTYLWLNNTELLLSVYKDNLSRIYLAIPFPNQKNLPAESAPIPLTEIGNFPGKAMLAAVNNGQIAFVTQNKDNQLDKILIYAIADFKKELFTHDISSTFKEVGSIAWTPNGDLFLLSGSVKSASQVEKGGCNSNCLFVTTKEQMRTNSLLPWQYLSNISGEVRYFSVIASP